MWSGWFILIVNFLRAGKPLKNWQLGMYLYFRTNIILVEMMVRCCRWSFRSLDLFLHNGNCTAFFKICHFSTKKCVSYSHFTKLGLAHFDKMTWNGFGPFRRNHFRKMASSHFQPTSRKWLKNGLCQSFQKKHSCSI